MHKNNTIKFSTYSYRWGLEKKQVGNSVLLLLILLLISVSRGYSYEGDKGNSEPFSYQTLGARDLISVQNHPVSGVVTDENGDPLVGVTVVVKGTTQGALSDFEGWFSIADVADTAVLVFTYVGYQTLEIQVGDDTELSVAMQSSSRGLDELVVVGYGVQKKESVVGAISQVSGEDLKNSTGNVSDLREALIGQIPGLVGLTSSGEPGGIGEGESATELYIRGQTTWNGSQPLVLVDGVKRDMNNIDVNDVETISVLKDASATAVYGVEGANGVIIITTKRGKVGKTRLHFNYITKGQFLSKQPDILGSYDAVMTRNESIEREGVLDETSWNDYVPYSIAKRYLDPKSPTQNLVYPDVDWRKALYKPIGFSHKAVLSARGGSKAVQYYGSLAYLHEGDMFRRYSNGKGYDPNYNFDRFNFRSNIDFNLTNTTKLSLNLAGYYSQKNTNWNNEGSSLNGDWWMWQATYGIAPNLFWPQYSDGRWGSYQEGANNTINPAAVVYNIGVRERRATQMDADFKLQQDLKAITKGLKLNISFSTDNRVLSQGGIYDKENSIRPNEARTNVSFIQFYPELYKGPWQDPSEYSVLLPVSDQEYDWVMNPWDIRSEGIQSGSISRRMTYQGQLLYDNTFDEKHAVTAMGVFKRQQYARGSEFRHYREDWAFRGTYAYDTKYLVEFNGAYNGSEKFGPGYRFHFFPSYAVGWNVANENFFDVGWINEFKIRYSTGEVGNDDVSGSRWAYMNSYSQGGNLFLGGRGNNVEDKTPYELYRISVIGNPDIHWETAKKNDLGIELAVLQNRFTLSYDYYTEDRTDILLTGGQRAIPPFFGAAPPPANLGRVKSKGMELVLGYNQELTPDLNIYANLALSHNENKVLFRDDPELRPDYQKDAGYPIGQQRSLVRGSMYQNWDDIYASVPTETNDFQKLPGYYDLVDFNGDGVIKNSEDVIPVGYSKVPQNSASLTIGAGYRGFSLMAQFYGVNNANRIIEFNNFKYFTDIVYGDGNFWSSQNPNFTEPQPRWKTEAENWGDYYMYDASYIRLRAIELAYSFKDTKWLDKVGMSDLRVFVNGNNLFYWSKLPDDRQSTYSGGSATEGSYPALRQISLGLDLNF